MSGFNRFLNRRDKTSTQKPRIAQGDIYSLFAFEDKKKKKDKEKDEKIKSLTNRLSQLGVTNLHEAHVEYALRSKNACGDAVKAFDLLVLLVDSFEGIISDYDPKVKMLGAENREKVTCYLDALLFAMFARLGNFEPILFKSFADEPRKRLSSLLRLWVNMLRTGKLVTVDVTKHIQDALANCGWEEASELRQHDASEAFTFITEQLELPFLTLKMDIYHTGKEEADADHRIVNERLLSIAIPTTEKGTEVTLEDCLENYFNNRIEVRRHLERKATLSSMKSVDTTTKGVRAHIGASEIGSTPSSPGVLVAQSPQGFDSTPNSPISARGRSQSLLQNIGSNGKSDVTTFTGMPSLRKGDRIQKEVLMPAWQFFSLMPWYTDASPSSEAQVAAHFSKERPVLGLCLKRYSVRPNGSALKLDTYVDIPLEIGLPPFIQDDNLGDDGPLYGNFKLLLQSVVCHRGKSVGSGHYISLVRMPGNADAPRMSTSHDGASEQDWVLFDDLAHERVTAVDVNATLRKESAYLLFYQVVPVDPTRTAPADGPGLRL
ncbi:MAG: hypothetical protein M1825_000960 [Sarcosagium campestre]|nr:MAG: hypothetical protein M1825_000960 [Sarcosagium campestre]